MQNSTSTNGIFDRPEVLTKAAIRAADSLGLAHGQLSATLGLSSSTLSRMRAGVCNLQPSTKSWEQAVLLVRLFQGLDRALDNDEQAAIEWMVNQNHDLKGRPVDLVAQTSGLARIVDYIEGYNARA